MRKQLAFVALALPLFTGLAACDGLQQAQQEGEQAQKNLDLASACMEALKVANFMPNFADPAKAKADAQAKADEIGALAQKTADQTLKQNLLDAQASVQQVASGQVTIGNSLDWMQAHLDKYQKVTDTCSKIGR